MITSQTLQNLTIEEFCHFFRASVIGQETELIIGKVVYEEFYNKKHMLIYDMSHISDVYHMPIVENLKTRLSVSSIYMNRTRLYIDWSLAASNIYVPCR